MNRQDFLEELSKNIEFIFDNDDAFCKQFMPGGVNELDNVFMASGTTYAACDTDLGDYQTVKYLSTTEVLDWIDEMRSKK